MKNIFFCIALLCVAACSSQAGKFNSAKVTPQDSHNPNHLCQHFTLTDSEALAFFTRATEINAMLIHQEYDYLPCDVTGTISFKHSASTKASQCNFSIGAGGTAELTCGNTESRFFGCKTCSDLLRDKP